MSEKKNLIIVVLLTGIILSGIFFFMRKKSSEDSPDQENLNSINSLSEENLSRNFPMGVPTEFNGDSVLDSEVLMNYNEFTDKLKTGELNFVWEVWNLRRLCPEDYKPDQCNEVILKHIDKSYSPPDNEQLKSLFKDYFRYESSLREFELSPNLKFEERYDLIKKKRIEILKEENSKLVFGIEEVRVDLLKAEKEFLEASKKLNGDEKVKAYNELKKKTLGQYYDNIQKREDPFQNYTIELGLREEDLNKMSPEAKQSYLKDIQIRYFGKEGAERIQKAQDEIAKNDALIQEYEKKSKEFISQNSSLSPKERDEKLKELRIKLLGEEEAGAYQRRKDFEEEHSNK